MGESYAWFCANPSTPVHTETWAWEAGPADSGMWVQLQPTHEPTPKFNSPVIATDNVHGYLLAMLASNGVDTTEVQAWAWNGSDWAEHGAWSCNSVSPCSGTFPHLVVTAPDGTVAGLVTNSDGGLALYRMNAAQWVKEPGTDVQATLADAIWNPATRHIVAIGTPDSSGTIHQVLYTFDGAAWKSTPLPQELQKLGGFEFAAEWGDTTKLILWGGETTTPAGTLDKQSATWRYDGNVWTKAS